MKAVIHPWKYWTPPLELYNLDELFVRAEISINANTAILVVIYVIYQN